MKQLLAALVVILAVSVLAVAQDSTSARSTPSSKLTTNLQSALQLLRQSRAPSQPIVSWHGEPGATLRLAPNALAAECYTMRIYRVKRTERLQDGDTGRRGYTTCEPGGEFQVRTATDQPSSK